MNIQSMSLEEKVGQLFIANFTGNRINGDVINFITSYNISGVYYMNRNLKHPRQVHKLSTEIQSYAYKQYPLFLAIHQEGGDSSSINEKVTNSPSQSVLGRLNNRLYTKQMAEIIGTELRAMGINMTISPRLDVTENNENAFGPDINLVTRHGVAALQGYHAANVTSAVKIDAYLDEVIQQNLVGSNQLQPVLNKLQQLLDTVVVSDSDFTSFPESLSAPYAHAVLINLLREKLTFEGVIIADHTNKTPEQSEDAAVLSIQAGVDMILLGGTYESQMRTIEAVLQAVKDKRIDEEQINKTVERILSLKTKRDIGLIAPFDRNIFMQKRSIALADKINATSILDIGPTGTLN